MPASPGFEKFYVDVLQEKLLEIDIIRRKAKKWMGLQFIPLLLGIAGFFIFFSAIEKGIIIFLVLGIAGIVLFIVFCALYFQAKKDYTTAFKKSIVGEIVKYLDPSFNYEPDSCINSNDYKRSGLFLKSYDSYRGDDYVQGKKGSTSFCFSELHTMYKVSSGKSTSWVTIFKGIFFMADFNKNFSGRTYAWSESDPQLNFFNKLFSSFATNLEKVKLESPEFENKFIVYSDNQVEARYILSTTLMEKMVRLQEILGKHVAISFVDSNINVAVPIQQDLFEPSIFHEAELSDMTGYYNILQSMIAIVEELDLNLRIWNKE